MESGTNISRNCIDLKRTDTIFESQPQPVVNKFAKSQHAPSLNTVPSSTNTNIKHSDKAKLIGKRVEAAVINLACTLHAVVTCLNQLQD